MVFLAILFLVTATLYSSVGFGGGSTYLALLLIWEIPYSIFPVIALFCNIIVVLGNSFNYVKAGNLNIKLLSPYIIGSIPLAYIGGSLSIEKEIFEILLFIVLLVAGSLLLFNFKSYDAVNQSYKKIPTAISVLTGGIIGFVSGVVGIGGGIFLSPILFLLKNAKPKHIVTTASLFILINSISGIIGQLTKNEVIKTHTSVNYLVYAIGFSPGFPYLGGLPEKLNTPRLKNPRTKIPAGSVAIAETQTGIYPSATPGGWQIIGKTPLKLFDPKRNPPVLLNPGDRIKFEPIKSIKLFKTLEKQISINKYKIKTDEIWSN